MRALRPKFLTMIGDELWVLDAVQPVGAILDPETGAVQGIRSWPQLPPSAEPDDGDPDHHWRVVAAADALWVQQSAGPLARVDRDGTVAGHVSGELRLTVATAHGVWCLPPKPLRARATSPEELPTVGGRRSWLRVVRPDGDIQGVHVETPGVLAAQNHDSDLFLHVETGHGRPVRSATHELWWWEAETQWLRLPAGIEVPFSLSLAAFAAGAPPRSAASATNGGRFHARWLGVDPTAVPDEYPLEPAGGRWWVVGHRDLAATSVLAWEVDADGGAPTREVDLGVGHPCALLGTSQHLWVAIEEGAPGPGRSLPTRLVRVHTATGAVETVLEAEALDISELGWPAGPAGGTVARPIETDSYIRFWQRFFASLDDCGVAQDGTRTPLSEGLRNTRAVIVGDWPDAEIEVTFDLDERPGLRLRRMIPLFDEVGRPVPPEYHDITIKEDLETGRVPHADEARDGILDF